LILHSAKDPKIAHKTISARTGDPKVITRISLGLGGFETGDLAPKLREYIAAPDPSSVLRVFRRLRVSLSLSETGRRREY
jgi:hypothetical protein